MEHQHFAQGQAPSAPRTVRRADGKEVPVSIESGASMPRRKFLIVLQYYRDDIEGAEQLGDLISQLERIRNAEADIAIYARHDAPAFSDVVRKKLEAKFNIVHGLRCRRRDSTSYPFAANEMFYDMVTLFGQEPKWAAEYYAFINLESDCVPLRPDWIRVLTDEFKAAAEKGSAAIGHIHNDPIRHMNGVGVYSIDMLRRVQGNRLIGGNPNVAYDIDQAKNMLTLCQDTPLIYFEYRIPTITPEDLFRERKSGLVPALFHGVKDDSARRAVKARMVTFSEKVAQARPNVFTYFHPIDDNNMAEHQAILKLWVDGWRSRGFNPIVLSAKEAVKNKHYVAFVSALEKMPAVIRKETQMNRFIRWLALDTVGGGLITEYDVLPAQLTPDVLGRLTGFNLARPRDVPALVMAFVDKVALSKWLDRMQNYAVLPEDTVDGRQNVTDANVLKSCAIEDQVTPQDWVRNFGEPGWFNAAAVHFSASSILKTSARNERKSGLMESFLRGEMGDGGAIKQVSLSDNPVLEPGRTIGGAVPIPADRPKVDLSDVVQELEDENAKLKARLAELEAKPVGVSRALAAVEPEPETADSEPASPDIGAL